jgi:hypothetical protein
VYTLTKQVDKIIVLLLTKQLKIVIILGLDYDDDDL